MEAGARSRPMPPPLRRFPRNIIQQSRKSKVLNPPPIETTTEIDPKDSTKVISVPILKHPPPPSEIKFTPLSDLVRSAISTAWIDDIIHELSYNTGDDEEFRPKFIDVIETAHPDTFPENDKEVPEKPEPLNPEVLFPPLTSTRSRKQGPPNGVTEVPEVGEDEVGHRPWGWSESPQKIVRVRLDEKDTEIEVIPQESTLKRIETAEESNMFGPVPEPVPAEPKKEDAETGEIAKIGGAALTLKDIQRTPEQKKEAEDIIKSTMKPGVEGLNAIHDTITELVKKFHGGQDRDLFENSGIDNQCEGVFGPGDPLSEICWLCGFPQIVFARDGRAFGGDEGGDPNEKAQINEAELDESVCEHKLPVKVAHYFRLMYSTFDRNYGQMDAAKYERIKKLYGTAHILCNQIKWRHLFLSSILGKESFGIFTENKVVIQTFLKKLLNSVQKRSSDSQTKNTILIGDRNYYWGSLVAVQTGEGLKYYRNPVMYRIHRTENFKPSTDPYRPTPIPKPAKMNKDGNLIPFSAQFTYPSTAAVKRWLEKQYLNIVGGLSELRALLNSEKDLYTEGFQVINRVPREENRAWWKVITTADPITTLEPFEELKHGLHPPFKNQLGERVYKPLQNTWNNTFKWSEAPWRSLPAVPKPGGGKPRRTRRRRRMSRIFPGKE